MTEVVENRHLTGRKSMLSCKQLWNSLDNKKRVNHILIYKTRNVSKGHGYPCLKNLKHKLLMQMEKDRQTGLTVYTLSTILQMVGA